MVHSRINILQSAPRKSSSAIGSELSVMAWIEDPFGKVLLVKQLAGRKAWTFPGGKVRSGETLVAALKREIKEELSVNVQEANLIDYFDRPEKPNVTFLFRVLLKPSGHLRLPKKEIEKYAYKATMPKRATASLIYFWGRAQKSFDPLSMLT